MDISNSFYEDEIYEDEVRETGLLATFTLNEKRQNRKNALLMNQNHIT